MTRLIVDEGGKRRAFKVKDGRMTVGSGPDATLRLASGDVADVHLDLDVQGGRARLSPRPGVLAPRVNGVPVSAETELAHGARVAIGACVLTIEYEDAPAAAPVAAAAAPSRTPRKPVARGRRKSAVTSGRARELHSSGRGLPGWLVVLLILAGVGAAGWLASKAMTSVPTDDVGASASILRAREELKLGRIDAAESRLVGLPYKDLEPAVRARFDEVRGLIDAAKAENALHLENMIGSEFLQTQLKNFESGYLAGKAEKPKVRVFLKRCAEFKRRWPKHPELDWVLRTEERFGALVNLSDPPDFEDIAFEVKTLTWADPRDFVQALPLLRRYADEEASVDERPKALALLDELTVQRQEWFNDRMQQARFEFERNQKGKSVALLVMLIVYSGDEAMVDQAAGELVKFDGLVDWLRGYQRTQPEKYAILKRQPAIGAYIVDHHVE